MNYQVEYKSKAFITDPESNIHFGEDILGVPDDLTGQARLDYIKERLLADSAPRIIEDIEITR